MKRFVATLGILALAVFAACTPPAEVRPTEEPSATATEKPTKTPTATATEKPTVTPTQKPETPIPTHEVIRTEVPLPQIVDEHSEYNFVFREDLGQEGAMSRVREAYLTMIADRLGITYQELQGKLNRGELSKVTLRYPVSSPQGIRYINASVDLRQPLVIKFSNFVEGGGFFAYGNSLSFSVYNGQLTIKSETVPDTSRPEQIFFSDFNDGLVFLYYGDVVDTNEYGQNTEMWMPSQYRIFWLLTDIDYQNPPEELPPDFHHPIEGVRVG